MAINNKKELESFLRKNNLYNDKVEKELKKDDFLLKAAQALDNMGELDSGNWQKIMKSRSYRYALGSLYDAGLLGESEFENTIDEILDLIDDEANKDMRWAISFLGEQDLLDGNNCQILMESDSLQKTLAILAETDIEPQTLNQEDVVKLQEPLLQHALAAAHKVEKFESMVFDEDDFDDLKDDEQAQKKLLIDSDWTFALQLQQEEMKAGGFTDTNKFEVEVRRQAAVFLKHTHENSQEKLIKYGFEME
ncbi:hypothetical protein [Piscirickettsia salmonis]|uniref:Uncharacterized protein n=1 Tax=Piscirickettsia salmonis TaxID=1238 RepID=A0A9Q6Q174_PISSA|nr:hypothetical protein [Piscirickettsia salmonis]ALA24020.1 hypothetical protein KW89_551 [Piscirickettsia salmonis]QGN76389.1 hypothetical protein Psal001_00570 [Piscirickettsia salmonis]QGN79979.1 hypothetical protein Psal002_00595 [Piscirickettsia salmonis]QGN85748.1 hypothetical protein Psal003_02836 [Piscirickettsia salmonis]QGN89254.1 hypothetical protein Psal004_02828 [Piscirickettsia salmonis]